MAAKAEALLKKAAEAALERENELRRELDAAAAREAAANKRADELKARLTEDRATLGPELVNFAIQLRSAGEKAAAKKAEEAAAIAAQLAEMRVRDELMVETEEAETTCSAPPTTAAQGWRGGANPNPGAPPRRRRRRWRAPAPSVAGAPPPSPPPPRAPPPPPRPPPPPPSAPRSYARSWGYRRAAAAASRRRAAPTSLLLPRRPLICPRPHDLFTTAGGDGSKVRSTGAGGGGADEGGSGAGDGRGGGGALRLRASARDPRRLPPLAQPVGGRGRRGAARGARALSRAGEACVQHSGGEDAASGVARRGSAPSWRRGDGAAGPAYRAQRLDRRRGGARACLGDDGEGGGGDAAAWPSDGNEWLGGYGRRSPLRSDDHGARQLGAPPPRAADGAQLVDLSRRRAHARAHPVQSRRRRAPWHRPPPRPAAVARERRRPQDGRRRAEVAQPEGPRDAPRAQQLARHGHRARADAAGGGGGHDARAADGNECVGGQGRRVGRCPRHDGRCGSSAHAPRDAPCTQRVDRDGEGPLAAPRAAAGRAQGSVARGARDAPRAQQLAPDGRGASNDAEGDDRARAARSPLPLAPHPSSHALFTTARAAGASRPCLPHASRHLSLTT